MRFDRLPHFHTLFFQGVGKVWKVWVKSTKTPPHPTSIYYGGGGVGVGLVEVGCGNQGVEKL